LGQDTGDIVSALTHAFKNNPDTPGEAFHASVRNNVVIALGYCHDQVEVVVPVLQKALQDPNARVREKATNALQRFQAKAPTGVN
jgi:HEAT repeat protein